MTSSLEAGQPLVLESLHQNQNLLAQEKDFFHVQKENVFENFDFVKRSKLGG